MANTLSTTKMKTSLRKIVSKQKKRFTEDGFDLDLSYITDRIIAMGYPAEKVESMYRNKIEDVQKMLDTYHPGSYKIYNLCSERNHNHKRFANYAVYPFNDHNPPDIDLINAFCRDVDEFLKAHPKNVVAVHCKAGKGRTGTMICCYLLYSRQKSTAEDALYHYAVQRTNDKKGVTIPSQRRYVEYYATLISTNEPYRPVTLYICEIRITPASINISKGTINVKGKPPQALHDFKCSDDHLTAKLDYCMPLAGDIKIILKGRNRCHFWFNTYFVEKSASRDSEGNLSLVLNKTEIDGPHKNNEFPSNFTVEVVLRRVPSGMYSETVSLKNRHPSAALNTASMINCGLENNILQHLPQQQTILQQHRSAHQQPALHGPLPPSFRQSETNNHQNSYAESNTNPLIMTPFARDQQQHYNQQNSLQQLPTLQLVRDYNQPFVDDNSECSGSESSTEEEGWDSGECSTPQVVVDNARLYYRNDNYYYGSCAGISAGTSDPSGPVSKPQQPAPLSLTSNNSAATAAAAAASSSSTSLISDSCSSYAIINLTASNVAKNNLTDSFSSRFSSSTICSSKLNLPLANTSAASNSSKPSVATDCVSSSSGIFSSASLPFQDSLPSLAKSSHDSSNNNGTLSSASAAQLTTSRVAAPSTNRIAWPSIGLKRKRQKSFKSSAGRSFMGTSREFGSSMSTCSGASSTSQRKTKTGKSRFHKLRWLKRMRSDPNLKEVLVKSGQIATLACVSAGNRLVSGENLNTPAIPIAAEVVPPILGENLLSTDYYSSICDKQLSFESPCKSPGHLMKLNLTSKIASTVQETLPDSECAIVIAKPSEQSRLKIGFDVSPTQSPTSKFACANPLNVANDAEGKPPYDTCDFPTQGECSVDARVAASNSLNLAPKSENISFCDRIMQTIVAGVGSRKSSDHELQVPSGNAGGDRSSIAPRVSRCSPFSLRELGQELKSVMMPSSSASFAPFQEKLMAKEPVSEGSISKRTE